MRKLVLEGWDEFQILVQRKTSSDLSGTSIISVAGGAQPDWVQRIVNDIKSGKDNDGLIHRFSLLINHEPPIEPWQYVDKIRDPSARDSYFAIFEALHEMKAADVLPTASENNAICFSAEAEEIFRNWLSRKENQIRAEGFSRVLAAHISKYTRAFASLALIFHLVMVFEEGSIQRHEISTEAAALAHRWCDYLSAHAERTFSERRPHPLAVRVLAKKILECRITDRMRVLQITEHSWMHLDTEAAVLSAARYLEKTNTVRIEKHGGYDVLRINPRTITEINT